MFKLVIFKILLIGIFGLSGMTASFATNADPKISIMKDIRQISYGAALVKFCQILNAKDYITFMEKLIKAERAIGFEHKSAYKLIVKQQEVYVGRATLNGKNCNENLISSVISAEMLMAKIANEQYLISKIPQGHPKNPKPNQAFIFASYLQARHAWIYQRQCKILGRPDAARLNMLMKQTQFELEHFFRPDQIASLNKRQNERHIRALSSQCKNLSAFINYAIKVLDTDIPNALKTLKAI